jgi:hypothetical protein
LSDELEDKNNGCFEPPVANLTHPSSVWINASHVTVNIDIVSSNFFNKILRNN